MAYNFFTNIFIKTYLWYRQRRAALQLVYNIIGTIISIFYYNIIHALQNCYLNYISEFSLNIFTI